MQKFPILVIAVSVHSSKSVIVKSSVLMEEVFSFDPKVCLSALTAVETSSTSPDGPGFGVVLKSGFPLVSKFSLLEAAAVNSVQPKSHPL